LRGTEEELMNPAPFRYRLHSLVTKVFGVSLCLLAAYTFLAASVWVLLHRYCPDPLLATFGIPLIAEFVLIIRFGTKIPLMHGLVTRFTGLASAGVLYCYVYLIPFVYSPKEPYPEEYAWTLFTIVMHCLVATVISFTITVVGHFTSNSRDSTLSCSKQDFPPNS